MSHQTHSEYGLERDTVFQTWAHVNVSMFVSCLLVSIVLGHPSSARAEKKKLLPQGHWLVAYNRYSLGRDLANEQIIKDTTGKES